MARIANAVCGIAAVSIAGAAQAAPRHAINIDPGSLGTVVVALGQQTGITIGMSDQSLAQLRVPAISGHLSVRTALRRVLADMPARAVRIDDRTWRIVRTAPPPPDRLVRRSRPLPSRPVERLLEAPNDAAQDDIVVTASKRDTVIEDYAGAISVIRGDAFTAGPDAANTSALIEKLPSLTSTSLGTGRNKLFIRGIADSGFAGPTQATVGQYLGEMRINYNAPDPDLRMYDVASIEVLEGPQGTLYGAGSLGGIIKTNPAMPDLDAPYSAAQFAVAGTAHGEDSYDGSAMLNLPLVSDTVGIRVSAYAAREGGYIDDTQRQLRDVNRVTVYGGRATASVMLDPDWRLDVSGLGQTIRGNDAQYAQRSLPELTRSSPLAQPFSSDYWLGNAQLKGLWGDIRIVSSIGVVKHSLSETYDATELGDKPNLFRQHNRIDLFSSETRFARDLGDGQGWLAGITITENRSRIERSLTLRSMPVPQIGVENRLFEWGAYGEATFTVLPRVRVTAGARFSMATLSGIAVDAPVTALVAAAQQDASRTETALLPSLAVVARPKDRLTLFLRYQQGFRPGGLAVDGETVRRFRNDRTTTIEGGFRMGRMGRDPVALLATAAYTEWNNIQADLTDGHGFPTTANIGNGRIFSLESQISVRVMSGLRIDGAVMFSDSRLDDPSEALQRFIVRAADTTSASLTIPNVAEFSGRVGLLYTYPIRPNLDFSLSTSARYVGKSRPGVGPTLGGEQGGFVNTLFGAKLEGPRAGIFLTVSNVLDAVGNRFALGTPFALPAGDEFTPLRPRTVSLGVRLGF